jgi:hypothetical protein
MASTNSMLLRPRTAPGSETRFQLWGGGDGGFTCEIGPRIRKQRSVRRCLRILASNRVFEVAVVGFEQLVDVWGAYNTVSITAEVMSLSGANVALQVLRLDGSVIDSVSAALLSSDGEVTLAVPAWVLSGEGIVKIRVTVNAPLLVSVRFNDTVLAVAP